MIPEPVKENVRELPAAAADLELVLNREVIPVLRKVREALNALLLHLAEAPAVTGSRADPEQALALVLTTLDTMGIIDDQTTV